MKDKKKILVALTGITTALKKGYDLLKQEHNLPEVPDEDLPGYSLHIVKALQQDLIQVNEEVQFEGMTYEEIVEKKEQQRDEKIKQMLAQAAEDLKKMKYVEPLETDSDPEAEPLVDQGDQSHTEDPPSDSN